MFDSLAAEFRVIRQLALLQFAEARRSMMPFAEARGYLTDEDVFHAVS